eukprot:gene6649-13464_t
MPYWLGKLTTGLLGGSYLRRPWNRTISMLRSRLKKTNMSCEKLKLFKDNRPKNLRNINNKDKGKNKQKQQQQQQLRNDNQKQNEQQRQQEQMQSNIQKKAMLRKVFAIVQGESVESVFNNNVWE